MTARFRGVEEKGQIRAEMASLYRACLTAEQNPCPTCNRIAQIDLSDGRITILACCEEYRTFLEEAIAFNR